MNLTRSSIPNYLTAARIAAVPLAIMLMWAQVAPMALLVLFVLASLTDFLDGYLARKWNCTSAFGALADPVADKLLVTLLLLYLLQTNDLPLTPVAVIILREIYVSALRDFISARGGILPVSKGGKWKTALQMLAISGLLAGLALHADALWDGSAVLLWIAALLAITSATTYTRAALPLLK